MPVCVARGALTGGGILEGGKEHAAGHMIDAKSKTSFKSEVVLKLLTPRPNGRPSMIIKPLQRSTLKTGVTAGHY
jgi:hypothetical protein